jgi:ribosome-binding factor A
MRRRGPPRPRPPGSADRKLKQLCAQVGRALNLTLTGACRDEVLQNLLVEAVEPAPDALRLQVTFTSADPDLPPATALDHLERARGMLRSAVAAAIHRGKTPELAFRVLPPPPRRQPAPPASEAPPAEDSPPEQRP